MVELALTHTAFWFLLAAIGTRAFILLRYPLAMRRAQSAVATAHIEADDVMPSPLDDARTLSRIFAGISLSAFVFWLLFVVVPRLGSAALTVLGS